MEKDGVSIATLYLFPVVKNRPKRSCRRASPSSPWHVGFLLKKISIFACFFFTAMVKLQVDKNVVYSKLHPSKSWLKLDSFCTYLSWGPHIFRHLFFSESKGKRSIFVTEIGLKNTRIHQLQLQFWLMTGGLSWLVYLFEAGVYWKYPFLYDWWNDPSFHGWST